MGTPCNAQALMCEYCSSPVRCVGYNPLPQPNQPTIIISGSFQCPGLAYGAHLSCVSKRLFKLRQLSRISPPVLHAFETFDKSAIDANGMLLDKLKTMSRPLARNASY